MRSVYTSIIGENLDDDESQKTTWQFEDPILLDKYPMIKENIDDGMQFSVDVITAYRQCFPNRRSMQQF